MSAQKLEVSMLGVETLLRLERDAWSMMVKKLQRATNEAAPPPPYRFLLHVPHPVNRFVYRRTRGTSLPERC